MSLVQEEVFLPLFPQEVLLQLTILIGDYFIDPLTSQLITHCLKPRNMSSSGPTSIASDSGPGGKKKSLKKKKKEDEIPSDLSQVPEEVTANQPEKNPSDSLPTNPAVPDDTPVSDTKTEDPPETDPPVENVNTIDENEKFEGKDEKTIQENSESVIEVRKKSLKELDEEKAKGLDELGDRDLEPVFNVESERVMTMDQFNERKSFFEKYIQELQDRLSHEEDSTASLNQTKRKLESDVANLKKDIENLELALQKVRSTEAHFDAVSNILFLVNRLSKTKLPRITRFET